MKPFKYTARAKYYDVMEAYPIVEICNTVLDRLLKKHKVKSVLDLTCGTGVQSIYLHKRGYSVTASDISKGMVAIAGKKYPKLKFHVADIRTARFGKFDAVISIFNAIGHLSKSDFRKAIKNISANLKPNGLYIFDIFNYDYMKNNFIRHEFIDVCKEVDETKYVRFNKNTFDKKKGIMTMNQIRYIQEGLAKPLILKDSWSMQIYSSGQLKYILGRNGFEVVEVLSMDGTKFDREKSMFMLTVARKVKSDE
jgi:SAM-dependent methyltransferase